MSITERAAERVPERDTTTRHRQHLHSQIDGHTPQQSEANGIADRKGLFGAVLDALHGSRRRQAARVIHQYRHLIAAPRSVKPRGTQAGAAMFDQPKGKTGMTTSDDAASRPNGRSTKLMTWTLITVCVIGFGILQIAGGAIINGAVKPSAEMPPVQLHGD